MCKKKQLSINCPQHRLHCKGKCVLLTSSKVLLVRYSTLAFVLNCLGGFFFVLVTHFLLVVIYLYNSLFLSFVLSERNNTIFLSFFLFSYLLSLSIYSLWLSTGFHIFLYFICSFTCCFMFSVIHSVKLRSVR